MADQKITELNNILGSALADADEFVVVDITADETMAVTRAELKLGLGLDQDVSTTGTPTFAGANLTGPLTSTGNFSITNGSPKITLTDTGTIDEFTEIENVSGNTFYNSRNGAANGQHIWKQEAGAVKTEPMRIDSSGALLHGTITAGSAGAGDIVVNGGVYLGGTAAANYLTDYEEGSFTPVVRDATTAGNVATVENASGTYTKVGNKVTVWLQLENIDTTGMTAGNTLYVTGCPFTPTAKTGTFRYNGVAVVNLVTFSGYLTAGLVDGSTQIVFRENVSATGNTALKVSGIGGVSSDLFLTFSYETT